MFKPFGRENSGDSRPMGTVDKDTIVAISTAQAPAGIGIVRLSGPEAFSLADRAFRAYSGKAFSPSDQRKLRYGHIIEGEKVLDEVLCVYMKAPHTYTAEDIVEVNCHGGRVSVQKVLALFLRMGARMAEPGEFTRRAFLNGRIDLAQAEAVEDIIRAQTGLAQESAVHQLTGGVSKKIKGMKEDLLQLLAHVEYAINFMEDAMEDLPREPMEEEARALLDRMDRALAGAETGRLIREGIKTVIVGRPNVGKSSLLNALLEDDRAIVTDIPGTTRDAIEESYQLEGLRLRLIDTAGIRETDDLVESLGVDRSMALLEEADLVLVLVDGSQPIRKEDRAILEKSAARPHLILVNKADLGLSSDAQTLLQEKGDGGPALAISAKTGQGMEDLEKALSGLFLEGDEGREGADALSNIRQIDLLEKARSSLSSALGGLETGVSLDALDVDLQDAYQDLAAITGESIEEDVLNKIFQDFCVGK